MCMRECTHLLRFLNLELFVQLVRELRKGRAFDGWSEGVLDFAPTYKYEMNSEKYCGEDPKAGRRIPSWYDSAVFEWYNSFSTHLLNSFC